MNHMQLQLKRGKWDAAFSLLQARASRQTMRDFEQAAYMFIHQAWIHDYIDWSVFLYILQHYSLPLSRLTMGHFEWAAYTFMQHVWLHD